MHYVRPDRVYRTGVLTPTANYAPGQDAQAVAAAFTQRSMNLSGPKLRRGLRGLRGLFDDPSSADPSQTPSDPTAEPNMAAGAASVSADGSDQSAPSITATVSAMTNISLFDKIKLRIQAWWSTLTQKPGQMTYTPGVVGEQIFNTNPYGITYAQMGQQVAPAMIGQVQMLAYLTQTSMPTAVAQASIDTRLERWNNLRWNG